MTNDNYDELDALTNPELVKKAMQEASRSTFRPKWTSALVDIAPDQVVPYNVDRNGREVRLVALRMINMRNIKTISGEVFDDDESTLELDLPAKPNANSEVALMTASAVKVDTKVNSIRLFPGLKDVLLVERVHPYSYRRPKTNDLGEIEKDDKGKDIWENVNNDRYYYSVESIGKGNAAKAKSSEPKQETIDYLLATIPDEGISEAEFKKTAIRDKTVQGDGAAMELLSSSNGAFVTLLVEKGKVIREDDKITLAP